MNYKNAPIVESVIDLRVRFKEMPSFSDLRKSTRQFSSAFPRVVQTHQTAISVPLNSNAKSADIEHKQTGFRMSSEKEPRILQFQQGGFAYNHLAPYSNWDAFSSEAKGYWQTYVSQFNPPAVARVAIRTINRFVIPEMTFKVEKYFTVSPQTPDEIGPGLSGFVLQLLIPQPALGDGAQARMNLTPGESDDFESSVMFLDIDLFAVGDIDAKSEQVWTMLEAIHSRRNELFELCMTDEARKLIS